MTLAARGARCGIMSRRFNLGRHGRITHAISDHPRDVALPLLLLALAVIPVPARAAPCGGDFGTWLQGVKQEAAADGMSQRTIQSALGNVTYDPTIIARDHAQGVFRQSFEQFSGRMVPPRLARARRLMLQQYGSIFSPHRAAIRRARPGDRRDLGTGNRFRRQFRKIPDHPLAGDAGLRLPPAGQVPRRS